MFGLPLYLRLIWKVIASNKDRLVPLTPKRFLLQGIFIPALFLGWLVHSLALFLDEIFFPAYRKTEVKEPVFVVGIPRSGTTFLHRVLKEDSGQFTTFQFWELVLAPSIIGRKLLYALARADAALGGLGRKALVKFDGWLLGGFRRMHHISLFEPEEDEWLLVHRFVSAFMMFAFPFVDELKHLLYFDDMLAPQDRARIMAYYKRCVQRHLYVHGPEKRLLSKNPSFSAKVQSLNETFPDAKIVCCVRNPYEAVPSFASLMWFIWGQEPGGSGGTPEMRQTLLDVVDHFYRHPMQALAELPRNRHAFLTYDALTRAPKDTILALYRQLGLKVSPDFEERLGTEEKKARAYRSSHRYAPEDFGLTRQDILENYRDIFAHYAFYTE